MTVKNALASGYSGGSGSVGFEPRMALFAARLNASMSDGCDDRYVGDVPVLVDVELQHDAAVKRHGRVRHEPVAAHLRDESAQPRPELDALGVELNRRPRDRSVRLAGC